MICFIDFETTGICLLNDYPIEIGAVLVNNDLKVVKKFHSYIKPNNEFSIKDSALEIHGLTTDFVLKAPTESTVLERMFSTLGTNFRLAAWNMSFDVAFFKMLCQRNSYDELLSKINYRHLDIQTINFIAKEVGGIPYTINSLSDILTFIGKKRSIKHNALEDALVLVDVYGFLINSLKNKIYLP